MKVQINTDSNIEGHDELVQQVEAVVRGALDRFSEQITRVEVYLSDENSDKKFGTDDKRCLLEARLAGLQPIAVSARVDIRLTPEGMPVVLEVNANPYLERTCLSFGSATGWHGIHNADQSYC